MPIHQRAHYQVNAGALDEVRTAIEDFVRYVAENEPGTHLYAAWQQDDPTRFVHLFIFEDEAAQAAHGESAAVRRLEAIYTPQLLGSPWSSPTSSRWPATADADGLPPSAGERPRPPQSSPSGPPERGSRAVFGAAPV